MINEYIFQFANDVYQVYSNNQEDAKNKLFQFCMSHNKTGSPSNRIYWIELANEILNNNFIITENFDFAGIKRIIN